jgi:hypothetical protein
MQLMLSVSLGPKVITLSDAYSIWKKIHILLSQPLYEVFFLIVLTFLSVL